MSPHTLLADTLTHNHTLFLSSHIFLPSPALEQLLLLQSLFPAPHGQESRRKLHIPSSPHRSVCLSGGSQVRMQIPSTSSCWSQGLCVQQQVRPDHAGATWNIDICWAVPQKSSPDTKFTEMMHQLVNALIAHVSLAVLGPSSPSEVSLHFPCALPRTSRWFRNRKGY